MNTVEDQLGGRPILLDMRGRVSVALVRAVVPVLGGFGAGGRVCLETRLHRVPWGAGVEPRGRGEGAEAVVGAVAFVHFHVVVGPQVLAGGHRHALVESHVRAPVGLVGVVKKQEVPIPNEVDRR